MDTFQTLSLLTSLLAVAIASVALYRTHRVTQKQLELHEKQAAFAAYQHEQLLSKQRADVRVNLAQDLNRDKLVFLNAGHAAAFDVTFEVGVDDEHSPIMEFEFKALFPIAQLRPGEDVSLLIAVNLQTPFPLPICVHWREEGGVERTAEYRLSP